MLTSTETNTIEIAGHPVPVVKGGLYDRYRSNPPLSVIAAELPGVDLSWFKGLEKHKVDIGFESYSPNFYYQNSRVTAVYTADLDALRALMPPEVLATASPLQVWPGRGLVAFTAYTYEHCDNDAYNEVAVSIITNTPGKANLGPFTLIGQSMSGDFWGYVLKLPVNTELARVRGVVGYNLPKWLTGIDRKEDAQSVVYDITDSQTGKVDVSFKAKKLDKLSREVDIVTSSFTNLDHQGHLAYGYAVSRQLRHGSSRDADSVTLTLGDGTLSNYLRTLKLGKMMKYEYVPEFQSALYAPKPLAGLIGER
ncbi:MULTISPECIES: acetoacetate decarboxylase (ADC) [Pseudomonas]|uniref:acetoacetate decarboxylase (ADC) n=1 Tax=Pseudomonas TaxID=286 RepID=UPI00168919F4|nr:MULTISPECIES: acetoacetate decarboxylase (ADC) [Pseudomonas]QNV69280.1 acetoacetate decarboxylase (ADC) [Pseudomonas sp. CFA]MCX2813349.1 acetoacetate decarboxylase (ADC) [Pseudomonas sp. DCB_E]MCX9140731.1 acetoacetate decarboxylase (ADC) [Pseudomonas sp. DCB_Q]MDD2002806.1 acetoacetate decarboxylase (ADC) [Pseudomonas putida]HEN8703639.1 acetoacetate decarboxylase (ADC) [Pseudomonas putida]